MSDQLDAEATTYATIFEPAIRIQSRSFQTLRLKSARPPRSDPKFCATRIFTEAPTIDVIVYNTVLKYALYILTIICKQHAAMEVSLNASCLHTFCLSIRY